MEIPEKPCLTLFCYHPLSGRKLEEEGQPFFGGARAGTGGLDPAAQLPGARDGTFLCVWTTGSKAWEVRPDGC